MQYALVELFAANVIFVGLHFAMSHPLRAPIVAVVGDRLFPAIYSLVSIASFAWIMMAFRAAPAADLAGSGEAGWVAATIIMLPAMVLFAGSFAGNPALPHPGAVKLAKAAPRGVFTVTRHPMMWSFALWALAHVILFWSVRTMITAIAMAFLALVGAHMQDRKKRVLMGDDWVGWQRQTCYWPQLSRLPAVGAKYWLAGAALWLAFTWGHIHAAGIPAGIWRWVG